MRRCARRNRRNEAQLDEGPGRLGAVRDRGGAVGVRRSMTKPPPSRSGKTTPRAWRKRCRASRNLNGPPSAGTEVIVFMSLSVPEPSWRQWSREAARIGAPLVLRGVTAGRVRANRERDPEQAAWESGDGESIADRQTPPTAGPLPGVAVPLGTGLQTAVLPGAAPLQGASLDPRLFRLFRIAHVPAVAVVPGGVPPCESRSCCLRSGRRRTILVTGNIGLEADARHSSLARAAPDAPARGGTWRRCRGEGRIERSKVRFYGRAALAWHFAALLVGEPCNARRNCCTGAAIAQDSRRGGEGGRRNRWARRDRSRRGRWRPTPRNRLERAGVRGYRTSPQAGTVGGPAREARAATPWPTPMTLGGARGTNALLAGR